MNARTLFGLGEFFFELEGFLCLRDGRGRERFAHRQQTHWASASLSPASCLESRMWARLSYCFKASSENIRKGLWGLTFLADKVMEECMAARVLAD
jgi:hypothetical protein